MLSGRVILSGRAADRSSTPTADPAYDPTTAQVGQWRRVIAAPMLKDGQVVGVITVAWPDPGDTPQRQTDLLKTFADQAVIAIENVRLINETKEALEQQTATAEVLQVISRSLTDAQPVFEKIAESCQHLVGGTIVGINLVRSDGQIDNAVYVGPHRDEFRAMFPVPAEGSVTAAIIASGKLMQFHDAQDPTNPKYVYEGAVRTGGRSVVFVPLIWEGKGLGTLLVAKTVVAPYNERELALLQTFADQAVIAIENVRLFNETKEALERQTATAEILQVIGRSVADTAPVFETILDSCKRLFATEQLGIFVVREDGLVHAAAWRGAALETMASAFPKPLDQTATGVAFRERRSLHIDNAESTPDAPQTVRDVAKQIGDFSVAWAPMLWEDRGVGSIAVLRQPPKPFTVDELALLKTFADQAAIAIQNARLFNETKEALEQQTATAEVLKAISRTTFELDPVLDALIENATRLCKSDRGFVFIREGDEYRPTASYGATPEQLDFMRHRQLTSTSGTLVGRVALDATGGADRGRAPRPRICLGRLARTAGFSHHARRADAARG